MSRPAEWPLTEGWPCEGGPLAGQILMHNSDVFEVVRQLPPGMLPAPGGYDNVIPVGLAFETARYRLMARGRKFAWVFQGWPE